MPGDLRYSIAMVRLLPEDGTRYETIDGNFLVTSSHDEARLQILNQWEEKLRRRIASGELGEATRIHRHPGPVVFDTWTLVRPDLVVAAGTRADLFTSGFPPPLLIADLLGESARSDDHSLRAHLYRSLGVKQYWIIDTTKGQIEIWTPEQAGPLVKPITMADTLPPLLP